MKVGKNGICMVLALLHGRLFFVVVQVLIGWCADQLLTLPTSRCRRPTHSLHNEYDVELVTNRQIDLKNQHFLSENTAYNTRKAYFLRGSYPLGVATDMQTQRTTCRVVLDEM